MTNQPQDPQPDPRGQTLQLLTSILESSIKTQDTLDLAAGYLAAIAESIGALAELVNRIQQPAAPAPAGSSTAPEGHVIFEMSEIVMTYDDKGNAAYKAKGGPYTKFGVRIWPEILDSLNVEPGSLKPGPNAVHPRAVMALMGETGPRKVVGLADPHGMPHYCGGPTDPEDCPF